MPDSKTTISAKTISDLRAESGRARIVGGLRPLLTVAAAGNARKEVFLV